MSPIEPFKEQISFQADAAIIDRLGRELVARQETALIELVKNGFDADATQVDVVLHGFGSEQTLEIRDNGSGMTREELLDGFLRLASDLKVRSPVSPLFGRQRAGKKGIGRFATQRLGDHLTLTTWPQDNVPGLRLTVDWTQFVAGRSLASITVDLENVDPSPRGTTIRIARLRDDWSDAQIRRCWRSVLALQQPFPVAPVAGNPTSDPGFKVQFLRESEIFYDETVIANVYTEILDHLHAVIELRVDEHGTASWSLSRNRFGDTRDWQRIHHEERDSANPRPYQHLRNAAMKTFYAILQPDLLPSLVYTRLRDVLAEQGGVRLYRNGFRVVPYGDPENDWLQLDETYAKRSFLIPIANRNFYGVVEVRDPTGQAFEEHTSREGLIETPAFQELRSLVSSVLLTAAVRISEDRGRKIRAGARPSQSTSAMSALEEISAAAHAAQAAADKAQGDQPAATQTAEQTALVVRLIEEKKQEFEAARAHMADEAAMLRFLATLGMTTAEFSHETSMTFDAFRLDFQHVFDTVLEARPTDIRLVAQAERAKRMLLRLDTLTSYMNALAGARSARSMHPVSLSKIIRDFERGIRPQAESQNIALEVEIPPYDPLYTRPMHEAELASVLLNFYTNAVKALKRAAGTRRVLIGADRIMDPEERLRLRFSDTGDGVPEANRERIFDAFFTTRAAAPAGAADTEHVTGTGLGLWIVRQIANNAEGEVSVVPAPEGFMTCFELCLRPDESDAN